MPVSTRFFLAVLGPILALAPSAAPAADGVWTLRTRPIEAFARLEGPIRIEGSTPLDLGGLPAGSYRLVLGGRGLERARARLVQHRGQLELQSWSGPQALVQPPGLVHLLRGESRGWGLMGAGLLGAGAWWETHADLQDARDRIDQARETLATATDPSIRARADADLQDARLRERDEERLRTLWSVYVGASWLGAGLESWVLTPRARLVRAGEGDFRLELPRPSAGWALLRSALHPGAGQRALGNDRRANFFTLGVAVTAGAAILAQSRLLDARRDRAAARRTLQSATDPGLVDAARAREREALSDGDDWERARSVLLGASAYLYAWNLLDAYLGGRSAGHARPATDWSLSPAPDGLQLVLHRRFH